MNLSTSRLPTLALVGGLALLSLGGCATYSSPAISVVSAQPTERTADGVAMRFMLQATNKNDVALPLRDVQYTLDLDGKQVFSGTRSAEATLRRLGTQEIVLPAAIPLTQEPGKGGPAHYRISGTISYVTPGQIAEELFDAGVRVPTVGFSGEGEIDLSQPLPPPKAPPSPANQPKTEEKTK